MVALECASCGYENTLEVLICMQSKLLDPNKAFACAYNLVSVKRKMQVQAIHGNSLSSCS